MITLFSEHIHYDQFRDINSIIFTMFPVGKHLHTYTHMFVFRLIPISTHCIAEKNNSFVFLHNE